MYINFKRLASFKTAFLRLFTDKLHIFINKLFYCSKEEKNKVCLMLWNGNNPDMLYIDKVFVNQEIFKMHCDSIPIFEVYFL